MYFDLLLPNNLILLTITLPLLAAIFISVIRHNNKARDCITIIVSLYTLLFIILIASNSNNGYNQNVTLFNVISNLTISFSVEPLGIIFALMSSFLWFITNIYAKGYVYVQNMQGNRDLNSYSFYIFISISMSSTFAIAFADNLFTIYIFYEILTISTYPLIVQSGKQNAFAAGTKYLMTLIGASLFFMLPSFIYIHDILGGISNFSNSGILADRLDDQTIMILFLFIVLGSAKAAFMPLHQWLPAAMVAPIPVSALLHAVAVVKAGIFVILKIAVYIFGINNLQQIFINCSWPSNFLTLIASITIIFASIIAIRQSSIKKMLAYSTIAQLSYCLIAISIFTPKAIVAAVTHMIGHAFGKITLFFTTGSIYTATRIVDIDKCKGLSKKLPITCLCFTIAALSITGVPILANFLSKFYIINAASGSINSGIIITTLVISTLLSGYYFFRVIYYMYGENEVNGVKIFNKVPKLMVLSCIVTCFLTIFTFMILPFAIELLWHIKF